jgi:transposase
MSTVAVLSGPERRRRWTSAEKRRIVEESLESGTSVTEVARRHEVHPNQLYGWRQQARIGALGCEVEGWTAPDSSAAFAAVTVAPEPGPASPARPASPGVIEIEFACGARLRITGVVEPATVSSMIAALAGARRR